MKYSKLIWTIPLLVSCLFAALSCTQEELVTGIDTSLPAPKDFTYDEAMSGKTSIALYWTAEAALNAGATSFTVQLTKGTDDNSGDLYDKKHTITIGSDSEKTDICTFSGLEEESRYYVRIRANYANSRFSKWVYLIDPADNEPGIIKTGSGFFDGPITDITALTSRLRAATATEIAVEWSITDFTDKETDIKDGYEISLYSDAECSNLIVKWAIGPNGMGVSASGGTVGMFYCSWTKENLFPIFKFGGLKPATEYWFKVVSTSREKFENVAPYKTEPSKLVRATAPANAGDIILFEDFGELLWGGDPVLFIPGYSSDKRGEVTTIKAASGENPVSDEEYKFFNVDCRTEMGLYNTLANAVGSTRLHEWGWMAEDKKIGAICARPGMIKLGAGSKCGYLVTPKLDCLSEVADITVTFDACPYKESQMDPLTATIYVVENSTTDETHNIKGSKVLEQPFTLDAGYQWKQYSFTIKGVTPGARIAIGGDRQGVSGQHRLYLDNICVKLDNYSTETKPAAPANLKLTAKENTITASWNAVSRADGYTLEYKKASEDASAFKAATEKPITETTFTLENLDELTEYNVRVKAHSADMVSDYSEIASITTEKAAGISNITTRLMEASATELVVEWSLTNFTDTKTDFEDGYTVALYKDQACADLVVKWNIAANNKIYSWKSGWAEQPAQTRLVFSSLTPETSYFLKVISTSRPGIESEVTEYRTLKSYVKTLPTSAKAGEVILHEDFSELLWGGNQIHHAAGYSATNRSKVSSISPAIGEDPTKNTEFGYYLVNFTTEMGLFSTLAKSIPNTRLKTWGWIPEEGDTDNRVSGRVGHVKLGAGGKCGYIATPTLDCLTQNADLTLTFDASAYGEKALDPLTAVVYILEDTASNEKYMVSGTKAASHEFTLDGKIAWKEYSIKLSNVKPGSRIVIGTDRQGVTGQHRLFLDNISVKVDAYK